MKKPERPKRTADDTRIAMLDAAEKRVIRDGPSALRLQDVAADVGVTHPAVLHHFGSREGLVRGVIDRAIAGLREDLIRSFARAADAAPDGEALFERVFETLFTGGQARLIAWLALAGDDPFDAEATRETWAQITRATHALRLHNARGRRKPTYEDTVFTVVLSALALFAVAVVGPATFRAAGLSHDAGVNKRFRKWLATMLTEHLARP